MNKNKNTKKRNFLDLEGTVKSKFKYTDEGADKIVQNSIAKRYKNSNVKG
jgi:hypothetical protein